MSGQYLGTMVMIKEIDEKKGRLKSTNLVLELRMISSGDVSEIDLGDLVSEILNRVKEVKPNKHGKIG